MINAFERSIEGKGVYKAGDEEWGVYLFETSYIGMFFDGIMIVPEDVVKAYRLIKNNEFEEERKNAFVCYDD